MFLTVMVLLGLVMRLDYCFMMAFDDWLIDEFNLSLGLFLLFMFFLMLYTHFIVSLMYRLRRGVLLNFFYGNMMSRLFLSNFLFDFRLVLMLPHWFSCIIDLILLQIFMFLFSRGKRINYRLLHSLLNILSMLHSCFCLKLDFLLSSNNSLLLHSPLNRLFNMSYLLLLNQNFSSEIRISLMMDLSNHYTLFNYLPITSIFMNFLMMIFRFWLYLNRLRLNLTMNCRLSLSVSQIGEVSRGNNLKFSCIAVILLGLPLRLFDFSLSTVEFFDSGRFNISLDCLYSHFLNPSRLLHLLLSLPLSHSRLSLRQGKRGLFCFWRDFRCFWLF